jgi:dolichol-phosphate mannosyltransferase
VRILQVSAMKILVAVPVFNEEKYVRPVLREIRKYARASAVAHNLDQIRVLVVDDGSTDSTPATLRDLAARGHIDLLTHPENCGYGQSLIDAFAYAAENGYDWVITMDCDEQHEPCRIPCFVQACIKDDADIISGSRYRIKETGSCLSDDNEAESIPPRDRSNINRLITELLNSSLHLNVLDPAQRRDAAPAPLGITDAFCGFKAHRVAAMARMNLTIPGYAFPMQFWVQADALNLRIREMAVKLIYKDATRHFGGTLDDPAVRLQHYLETFTNELREVRAAGIHARRELAEVLFD